MAQQEVADEVVHREKLIIASQLESADAFFYFLASYHPY